MGELVNLRQERKRKERDRKAQKADANRARHGRSRGERSLTDAEHQKSDRHLDAHRISGPDASDAAAKHMSDQVSTDGVPAKTTSAATSGDQGDSKATVAAPKTTRKSNVVSIFAPNIPDRK
ncbi:DUF4169 family protein [Thalassospira lucentensis]|uniref:DUF4169 family protein n=1 Tax=Thalassospira lucentensis TaxID=168935 RepID=UPI003AA98D82